jgi:hypothetical protein
MGAHESAADPHQPKAALHESDASLHKPEAEPHKSEAGPHKPQAGSHKVPADRQKSQKTAQITRNLRCLQEIVLDSARFQTGWRRNPVPDRRRPLFKQGVIQLTTRSSTIAK